MREEARGGIQMQQRRVRVQPGMSWKAVPRWRQVQSEYENHFEILVISDNYFFKFGLFLKIGARS